jgi:glycerophosphoryl diester phosphodiesterase
MVVTILSTMTSGIAARHPYLDWPGPIAFAHRGGAAEAPENTMRAFSGAVALGYRYLETDVRVTADGVAVTFHDETLTRMCGRPERVCDLTAAELAEVRVSGSEAIPTLEEVLDTWPEIRLNVDCKDDRGVRPLVDAVSRHGALNRVCLTSFADRRVVALRRALGRRLCTAAGQWELTAIKLLGVSFGSLAAQAPVRQSGMPVTTSGFVRRCHRLGLAVHVWTIDDAAEMDRLLDLGVDGVMTDRPTTLRDVLVARGEWRD